MGTGTETGSSCHGLTVAGDGMRPVRDGRAAVRKQADDAQGRVGAVRFPPSALVKSP